MSDELIKKLEEAHEGSRELDALIWAWERPSLKYTGHAIAWGGADTQVEFCVPPKRGREVTSSRGPYPHAKPVTTSLDAALALAERVLKERGPIDLSICGSAQVVVHHNDPCGNPLGQAYGNTPALALCLAILKATQHGQ